MWKICFCFLSQAARVSQWCNYPLVSCMKPFIRCHSERKNLTETKEVRRLCTTCVRRFDILICKFRMQLPFWPSDWYLCTVTCFVKSYKTLKLSQYQAVWTWIYRNYVFPSSERNQNKNKKYLIVIFRIQQKLEQYCVERFGHSILLDFILSSNNLAPNFIEKEILNLHFTSFINWDDNGIRVVFV